MSVAFNGVLPQSNQALINQDGTPTVAYAPYVRALDMLVKALASGNVGTNLVNAANDAAAAKAGVALGFIYRNGSQLMVRVS